MAPDSNRWLSEAVGLSGSPGRAGSRSRLLLDRALARLVDAGLTAGRIDLAELSASGLLGRDADPGVEHAIAAVREARILVVATPIYRATYSGLLKVFFDLLPHGALEGKVAIPIATGGSPGHLLAIDHGLRPLLASLGALTVANGVYGIDGDFTAGIPSSALVLRLESAVAEALALVATSRSARVPLPAER